MCHAWTPCLQFGYLNPSLLISVAPIVRQQHYDKTLFQLPRLLFWHLVQEASSDRRSLTGVVTFHFSGKQRSSALRGACSRNIRLCHWSFCLTLTRLCFISGKRVPTFRAAFWNSSCLELNDKQTAAQNHSVILGARWRARAYFAVRLW